MFVSFSQNYVDIFPRNGFLAFQESSEINDALT